MPTYTAQCESCNTVTEYIQSVANSGNTPECCGAPMKKVILSAPLSFVKGRFEAFKSPVDGSIISSERAMREHNARNGVVSLADGYSDDTIRKGEFSKPKQTKLDPTELRQDLAEAVHKVTNGYRPKIEVQDDD